MRGIWIALWCVALTLCAAGEADAQTFPTKPIRLVVPYPAGGSTDLMARMLQEPLAKLLGQPVIVDNRPGAAGAIGSREVANAPADGHTLVFSNNGPTSIAPAMQKDAGYDSKSFAPVSLVAVAPLVLIVHASVPVENVAEFISYAKAQPGGLFYSSAGPGSLGHLSAELLTERAGIKMNHVPYKGQAPATMAVLTGDVKVFFSTSNQTLNDYVQDKKLKVLGISSAEPSSVVPNVPSIGETVKGYAVDVWFGILAPSKTPPPVIARLNSALVSVLAQSEIKAKFAAIGHEAKSSTPERFADIIASEVPEWAKIISENNVRAE
ncbi:tripartite tricarboxylate transporter substrate binding protein [Bradyrhizobium sp. LHD-71]|uniref:Bug family tripartite tricarboxylate transporter substrate binding protein n=1 Tax=Bradyrhizobium sp. LHD-71 TaxID=3072141 RepID=UPI00280D9183|nr:tripartite tricarboxylate transporter substrate binding protein [Bradyrhizobium sp. LHD-71]MDQ8727101.1 tripartite tricarboxylate transporter substrate binding protein [Bradyrhizobium sp. LHD-71]